MRCVGKGGRVAVEVKAEIQAEDRYKWSDMGHGAAANKSPQINGFHWGELTLLITDVLGPIIFEGPG